MEDIVVIGAGIAGLTTTYRLLRAGRKAVCLEADEYPGGCVRTERSAGYLCERGAQNFLEGANGPVHRLAYDLGIADQIITARETRNFIALHGRPWSVPNQLHHLVSFKGLLRAGLELFLPRGSHSMEESIATWAHRRFGREVALHLIDPMVSGIWAGDPERLSLEATLTVGVELERKYRSVMLGAFKCGAEKRQAFTFRQGMGTLPERLAQQLGSALHTSTQATRITADIGAGYRIEVKDTGTGGRGHAWLQAEEVVIATPAPIAAALVAELDPGLGQLLRGITCATMVSCSLGFLPTDFLGPVPQGYGLIRPHCQGSRALGCLFSSSAFAGVSPPNRILIRMLMGGQRDPEAVGLADAELIELALQEFGLLLGLKRDAKPTFVQIFRHRPGLPQYELGHLERLRAIDGSIKRLPGLHLVGNSYRGVPVGQVIEQAHQLATHMLRSEPAVRSCA